MHGPKHGSPGTLVTTARHGHGKRWQARWVDNDGLERSRSFDRKTDATQRISSVTAALSTGTYADPQQSAVTFGSVAKQWLASKATLRPKSVAGYESLLDTVILPRWGNTRLRDIDHAGMQTWITWLSTDPKARQRGKSDQGGLSPTRVIQAHQVIHQVFAYAIRVKYIAVNPTDGVQLPRRATAEKKALTHEQVSHLAQASGEVSTMVYVLAYAGLRFGECVALRVGDVDLTRRWLAVSRSITGVRGKGRVEGPTKTHQKRNVPILTTSLIEELKQLVKDRDPSEFLFPGPDGGSMSIGWFRVRFDKAVAKLGVPGVTPHTLRHSAGSLAISETGNVVMASKLLGHRNVSTTANIYSHMLDGDWERLASAMDSAVRNVVTGDHTA